jgi:hypothetical protein
MRRSLLIAFLSLTMPCLARCAPLPEDIGPSYIDLADKANAKLTAFASPEGNNLAKLPTGKQTFADVKFKVGESLIQLGSGRVTDKARKVEGIKVDRVAAKLRFLHSAQCSFGDQDGQVVAKYVVHYDDKTTADVELVAGRDLTDWWLSQGRKPPSAAKVGWEGENDAVKDSGTKIQLYVTTWENPHPKKKIVSIDFVNAIPDGSAAAFVVAITAEEK